MLVSITGIFADIDRLHRHGKARLAADDVTLAGSLIDTREIF